MGLRKNQIRLSDSTAVAADFNFSQQCNIILMYKSYAFLIPKYFILFDAILNKIISVYFFLLAHC